eukprot:m.918659 g.918659  ORF g.918659 m.918659 type:complete len:238 (-) comp23744_c3_seq22:46-759(-)
MCCHPPVCCSVAHHIIRARAVNTVKQLHESFRACVDRVLVHVTSTAPPCEFCRDVLAAESYGNRVCGGGGGQSNVGVVLDTLDALDLTSSTLTVFMGDHGWQLGEMDEWRKMTNWELGVRVPLIIRCPWKPHSQGVKTPALVEAVDLFQTITTLVGFPDPTVGGDGFPVQDLQGNSLAPYFDDPPTKGPGSIKTEAYSQFPKQNDHGVFRAFACTVLVLRCCSPVCSSVIMCRLVLG